MLNANGQELYPLPRYNLSTAVFDGKHEELEHFETRMGVPRGRLAVTMDLVTDAMARGRGREIHGRRASARGQN